MMPMQRDSFAVPLKTLLKGLVEIDSDICIAGLSVDARKIQTGDLFLAVAGSIAHGLSFAEQAISHGVAVIVYDPASNGEFLAGDVKSKSDIKLIALDDLSGHVSAIAARFYSYPSEKMSVIGITGTNGKTSVSHFVAQALTKNKTACGVVGTLGWGLLDSLNETINTTPDAVSVQSQLSSLLNDGVNAVAMEVSSHGLDQARVEAVDFKGAIFTNLSHDHLDYHKTLEAYGQAKLSLFKAPSIEFVVLNGDDEFSQKIRAVLAPSVKVLSYSRGVSKGQSADNNVFVISGEKQTVSGLSFKVGFNGQSAHIKSPLFGSFNVDNLVAALACLVAMGQGFEEATVAIQGLKSVAGRMESISLFENCPTVVVDYAHTPDALKLALSSLREHCTGELKLVFGCGGNRDEAKRAVMGRIAVEGADQVVITNDNPRFESAEKIAEQIQSGTSGAKNVQVILNREQAIQQIIADAGSDDIVLVAGKGHEDYQQVKDVKIAFSDVDCVKAALNNRVLITKGEGGCKP